MSFLERLFGSKKETTASSHTSVLSYHFEKYTDFGQIVLLFDFVLNPNDNIALKAAETIHHLFVQKAVFESKQLYETFKYLRIDKSDITKFERFPEHIKLTLLCIASLNANGYSREAALEKLAKSTEENVFPFVLFRLADWVKPIRENAEQIIREFISPVNAMLFIRNHKLISWLITVERVDLSALYSEIIDCITQTIIDWEKIKLLSDGQRFFYIKSLIGKQALKTETIDFILRDKYYLNRLLLIRYLDQLDDGHSVLLKLITDKSHKVRLNAINWISDQNLTEFRSFLEPLIFDSSSSIRFASRNLLNKIGTLDYRKLYKQSISEGKFLIGSIIGLSEIGDKSDMEIVSSYLKSEKPRVKSAALIGLYNLDNDLATELAYDILAHENPVNTKKVSELILTKHGCNIRKLREIYDKTDYTGKKVILRLINRFGGWSAAGDFLKTMTENDSSLVKLAEIYLFSWLKYTTRLGMKQSQEDKDYVMLWHRKAKIMNIKVSDTIPFIFGEK